MDETAGPTAPRVAVVAIAFSFALAAGVAVLRTVTDEPVERTAELAGNLAFGLVFAAPAMLGVLGLRRRPSLLVAAGVVDIVLALLLLSSLVGLVFLVPATMFFLLAGRTRGPAGHPLRSAATVLIAVTLSTAALFALFVRKDPICWATDRATGAQVRLDPARFVHGSTISMGSSDLPPGTSESGCSSDSISKGEALLAATIVAVMLGAVLGTSAGDAARASPQVDSRPEHGGVAQR